MRKFIAILLVFPILLASQATLAASDYTVENKTGHCILYQFADPGNDTGYINPKSYLALTSVEGKYFSACIGHRSSTTECKTSEAKYAADCETPAVTISSISESKPYVCITSSEKDSIKVTASKTGCN